MIKKLMLSLLAGVLVLTAAACTEPAKTTGAEDKKEKRVVAGTVAAAQYLAALEVDVAGIPTTDKELPEMYKGKPQVGMPMSPNLEQVLTCEPDIFVADSSSKATLEEMFYGQNVEVVLLDNNSFESIETNITLLGEKLGLTEKAKEVTNGIKDKKESAIAMAKRKVQPKVAVIFGTTAMFMLGTDASCTGSMVDMLGASNITDDMGLEDSYVTFDREKLAELNPDVILRLSHADPAETAKAFETEFSKPFWQDIKAVKDKRVYDLDIKYFGVTANYNTIEAPRLLAEMLYGK